MIKPRAFLSTRHARSYRATRTSKWARFLLFLALIITLILWWRDLNAYVNTLPKPQQPHHIEKRFDAIIVFTGGAGRLDAGMALWENKVAPVVFISGVPRGIELNHLLRFVKNAPELVPCCIDIGHRATGTWSNAKETRDWINTHHIDSVMLVTSHYHVKRASMLLTRAAPQIDIESFAVHDKPRLALGWGQGGAILITEHSKFIVQRALSYFW